MLKKDKKNIRKIVMRVAVVFGVTVLLFIYATLFAFQIRYESFEVEGSSMETTFFGGEKVYVEVNKAPKHKDIVVANYVKDGEDIFIIKRVVAVAGDSIDIIKEGNNYFVVRNGDKLTEDYVDASKLYEQYKDEVNGLNSYNDILKFHYDRLRFYKSSNGLSLNAPIVIDNGYVFLMGDNRIVSEDSTRFGPKKLSELVGVVNFIVERGVSGPELYWKQICFAFTFK